MLRSRIGRWVIGLAALALIVGGVAWYKFFRELEQSSLEEASAEEWFKYGSIGSERDQGVPYWIWRVLPKMFPEYLPGPGGYAALGVPWEQGQELPVGFSKKTIGFPRVAFNCAFCHSTQYRLRENELPTILVPGPGNTVRPQEYARFLAAAAQDAKFNPDEVMREIGLIYELSWLDKLLYRYLIIPATKKGLIQYGQQFAWTEEKPPWGTGRIDPFNPIKFGILQMGIDATIGNSDMMPIWNMQAREGHALHWDGLNTDLHEVVISSAIGDGMTYRTFDRAKDNLARIEEWIKEVPAPAPPFDPEADPDSPYFLDRQQAAAGKDLYRQHCAKCHASGGERHGTVIPVEEVGTDHHRAEMWTAEAARRYNAYQEEYEWGMRHFQDVDGYVAVPHDGLWLRGPYLHNGSVPTLRDMLKKPEDRPKVFYRGYDLFDPVAVGFVSQGEQAERRGWRYDTRVPGNSNQGHLFGTDLTEEQKEALLEYLKTL